jgi:transposase InsO family protein
MSGADGVLDGLMQLVDKSLVVATAPSDGASRYHLLETLRQYALERLVTDWPRHLALVRPETVLRWHRRGWRLFWWWRSRRPRGRPRLPREVRDPIRRLSDENRLWGTERIRGDLLRLGIAVSAGSIRRYRGRRPQPPPSETWRTFLANHAAQIWAADLFTVPTATFRTLSVLFFITHDRRELVHCRVTAHPTAVWVWRQLVEATPWNRRPKYLVRDRDAVYGRDFPGRARGPGICTLLTPFRAPRANAIAERVIRTLRTECLDHVLVLHERHLEVVLQEYTTYYNRARPHRSLGLVPLVPGAGAARRPGSGPGRIIAHPAYPVLGGLHHVYERAA